MIKTIIFDLGRVLVPFDFNRGYDRMAQLCNYPASEIPKRLRTTDLVADFESGRIEPHEFARLLGNILELKATHEEFCEIWSSIFLPYTLIPESLVEALHHRYRLVLLSNTNAIHFPMVKQNYPILRHFDSFVLSYQVGVMKPSPLIYQRAIEEARCAPEQCFFTDDIPAYVEGAKESGIQAVVFENHQQIERELRSRGIAW